MIIITLKKETEVIFTDTVWNVSRVFLRPREMQQLSLLGRRGCSGDVPLPRPLLWRAISTSIPPLHRRLKGTRETRSLLSEAYRLFVAGKLTRARIENGTRHRK